MKQPLRVRWWLWLGVLLLAFQAGSAEAGVTWCKADPIVRLQGTQVQFLTSIPAEYVALVDGPIRFEIKTPQSKKRELLFIDSGFNGQGEDFSWSDLGDGYMQGRTFNIWVKATVNLKTSQVIPLQVEMIPENGPPRVFVGTHKGTSFMTTVVGMY